MTILGYDLSYLELAGSIFSFASVILATRANIWTWPTGIVGQILFFFLFLNNELYGNMALQIFFTVICILGWYNWNKEDDNNIKRFKFKDWIIVMPILALISATIALNFTLKSLGTEFSELDASITVLSISAVFLLSYKYLESWIIWILVDILSVILFYLKGINLISIEYVLITGIAIYGFINWIKIYGKQKHMG
jgi:nicotinamide mononucleotide transporter